MLPLRPAVSTCCCAGAEPSPGRLDSGWDDPASSPPYGRTRYRRKQTADVTLAPALTLKLRPRPIYEENKLLPFNK